VIAARRMTPDDLIKLIIISARYNQVMWKRQDSNKDSPAPSQ